MRYRGAVGLAIAGSMLFSSTVAVAEAAPPSTQPDPWAVLSVMSGGASAAALCGMAAAAAVTAAQPAAGCVLPQIDVPPPVAQTAPPQPIPVPPVEGAAGAGISPLLLGLLALAGAVGLYFALRHHHHHHPNSPA
jgi:hypothetical protein